MKKGLLNYATIISITILIILNGTTSIYAYNILENNDKTLDILVINSYDSKNEWENHVLTGFEIKTNKATRLRFKYRFRISRYKKKK